MSALANRCREWAKRRRAALISTAMWLLVLCGAAAVAIDHGRGVAAGPPPPPPAPEATGSGGRVACPQGGDTREAFARPRLPRPGEILDREPRSGLRGWRIVRGADLLLPSGRLAENGGEYIGDVSAAVDLGVPPGPHPWFLIMARYSSGRERPGFAQLVLDPAHRPVRWAVDDRFGFGTDGGMGLIAAPEVAETLPADPWESLLDPWIAESTLCLAYRAPGGARLVIYDNGYGDGFFPGVSGFDRRGRRVAIAWPLGSFPWALAGFPGTPPRVVRDLTHCRRALAARGVDRRISEARCFQQVLG